MLNAQTIRICNDPTGLAVLLSHEIAGIVANHEAERKSINRLLNIASIPFIPFIIPAVIAMAEMDAAFFLIPAVLWVGAIYGFGIWKTVVRIIEADALGIKSMRDTGFEITDSEYRERMKSMRKGREELRKKLNIKRRERWSSRRRQSGDAVSLKELRRWKWRGRIFT